MSDETPRQRQVLAAVGQITDRATLVSRFAPHMQRELAANAWKGDDWRARAVEDLAYEVLYHAAKAAVAVGLGEPHRHEAILEMSADVANCAAMLADAIHALDEPPASLPEAPDQMPYVGHKLGSVELRKWAANATAVLSGSTPTDPRIVPPPPPQEGDVPF